MELGSVPVGDLGFPGGSSSSFRFGFSAGSATSSSLLLDGEIGELVRAPSSLGGRKGVGGVSDTKTALALKSHSEAEKRRRERINAHLAKLRSMVPCTDKLDKAALLAEVINHVKVLKREAVEVSGGYTIPTDVDEVRVEVEGDATNNESFLVKASLCCEDRPELLTDIRQTLQSLQLRTIRAEMSTVGGRIKNVFVMKSEGNTKDVERDLYVTSVHQALQSILDRVNLQVDLMPRASFSSKRRRISFFESSSSSS